MKSINRPAVRTIESIKWFSFWLCVTLLMSIIRFSTCANRFTQTTKIKKKTILLWSSEAIFFPSQRGEIRYFLYYSNGSNRNFHADKLGSTFSTKCFLLEIHFLKWFIIFEIFYMLLVKKKYSMSWFHLENFSMSSNENKQIT